MTPQEIEKAIRNETHGVIMPYGNEILDGNANFMFVVVPKQGNGAQWHRDIIPALRRYTAKMGKYSDIVTGIDNVLDTAALELLQNRYEDKNWRLWIAFSWEDHAGKQRGVFNEVDFTE